MRDALHLGVAETLRVENDGDRLPPRGDAPSTSTWRNARIVVNIGAVLHFTGDDRANRLLAEDPMALLVGFALDQQVTVEKAFMGPLVIRERLGTLEAAALAAADLDTLFRQRPAIHRYPGAMATRVRALAEHVRDEYGGDAEAVWRDAASPDDLLARLRALPGFGTMKVKAIAAVLAKRLGVALAEPLVPWHPTLGDVDSPQGLADYKAAKRLHKKEWEATAPGVSAGSA